MALINKRAKVGWQDEFGRTPLLVPRANWHCCLKAMKLIDRDASVTYLDMWDGVIDVAVHW